MAKTKRAPLSIGVFAYFVGGEVTAYATRMGVTRRGIFTTLHDDSASVEWNRPPRVGAPPIVRARYRRDGVEVGRWSGEGWRLLRTESVRGQHAESRALLTAAQREVLHVASGIEGAMGSDVDAMKWVTRLRRAAKAMAR